MRRCLINNSEAITVFQKKILTHLMSCFCINSYCHFQEAVIISQCDLSSQIWTRYLTFSGYCKYNILYLFIYLFFLMGSCWWAWPGAGNVLVVFTLHQSRSPKRFVVCVRRLWHCSSSLNHRDVAETSHLRITHRFFL